MNAIALLRAHARIGFLDLIRTPGYVVPTILFPAMFFSLFDLPYARTHPAAANAMTLAFIVFAITGVTLYQFGVGIAQERGRPWERYLRTLPVSIGVRFSARIVIAIAFGIATAMLLAAVALVLTPIHLTVTQWLRVGLYSLGGGVPFVLIGISLGYWTSPRAAVPIATACNLLLAYAGALWMPPGDLPNFVQSLSPYLPTRQFADLLWSATGNGSAYPAMVGLGVYAVAFAGIAALGYRRDERRRYA